ncbi:MAG: hypothetical protein AAGE01_19265 [Pseudomonadota bacterium]
MTPRGLALGALLLAAGGCATSPAEAPVPVSVPDAAATESVLRIESESVLLGDAVGKPLSLEVYVARIQQNLVAGRDEAVGDLVRVYPDLARQVVLSAEFSAQSQYVIAAWLDGHAAPARGGWATLVADRVDHPDRYATWARSRAAAWYALRGGAFAAVAEQPVEAPAISPSPWPALGALQLQATAMLAAGRANDAAPLFEQIAEDATAWDLQVAARAGLFAALAHQIAGNIEASRLSRDAVAGTVNLPAVHDPMILRLLLETRAPGQVSSPLSRRAVRARLGRVELERDRPQAALLAWRAAETEPGLEPSLSRIRLGQAEALLALRQEEPAIAMLIGLADSDMRPEALVMLGLLQMHRGQLNMGLSVLQEAVAASDADSHPSVYADVGLALLTVGEQELGQDLVAQARESYTQKGDLLALARLLNNELRYAEAIGDTLLMRETRQALIEVDQQRARGTAVPQRR